MKTRPSFNIAKRTCCVLAVPCAIAVGVSATVAAPSWTSPPAAPPVQATFSTPSGVAVKFAPLTLYVADYIAVRKIVGNNVTTLAGPNDLTPPIHTCANGFLNGTGQNARFNYISGIAVGQLSGNVYVTEHTNNTVRKITPAGVVTTFAGAGPLAPMTTPNPSVDGIGTAATFNHPNGIVIDPAEQFLYVADSYDYSIRRITVATKLVKTVVASHAAVSAPTGIAIDPTNPKLLYIMEQAYGRVRKLDMNLYTGTPLTSSSLPIVAGPPLNINIPAGIALDAAGALFLTEGNGIGNTVNHVRKGAVNSPLKPVVAGAGVNGLVDANGLLAKFDTPAGIALNPGATMLFIADQRNNVIRQLKTTPPYTVTTYAGHAPGHPNSCADGTK